MATTIPELTRHRIDKLLGEYCAAKVPAHVRTKRRLIHVWRGKTVTLIEERPPWDDRPGPWTQSPIARFDYNPDRVTWTLRCRDRNQRWHLFDLVAPTPNFKKLLDEVEKDRTGIFWG